MNKFFLLCFSLLLFLPACLKRGDSSSKMKSVHLKREKLKVKDKTGKSLFLDEDIQEYAFEDENVKDSMLLGFMEDETSMKLVDSQNDDNVWASRHADQAVYGFKSVYFGFDRFSLNAKQNDALEYDLKIVKNLTKQGKIIIVEGHACNSAGSAVYNMMLSEKRAQSVARYFVDHGISVDQLKVVGRGDEMCIVPSGDRKQQAPNRRVELHVM